MTPTEAPVDEETTGINQHPESQDDQEEYGPNNEKMPDWLVNALRGLVQKVQAREGYNKYMRREEFKRDWRNRLYDKGFQHNYWSGKGDDGAGFAAVLPGGLTINSNGQSVQAPRFVDSYDIFGPYMSILTAVQTQDDPDIAFEAKNPNRSQDIDAAKEAEGFRDIFDRENNVNDIDVRIFRMLALSGRVVAWTRTETDPQKFGYAPDGTPRTMQTSTIFGTIESRVPILAKTQGDCFYCILVDDIDVRVARAAYPNFKKDIKAGEGAIGESGYERMGRLGVMQNSAGVRGNAFSDLTARSNCWLRPSCFEDDDLDAASPEDPNQTIGQKLAEMFPLGCHVTFMGNDTYVGSWAESMDDALTIRGGPKSQDGMFQRALMDPIVVVQDAVNDGKNTAREIWDVGWPSTWWAAEETEYDAAADQRADPYALRLLKDLPAGSKASDRFYREPDPVQPEGFIQYITALEGQFPEFQLAAQPSLWGGEMPDNKTLGGRALANHNALGTQGLTFRVKEEIWASIYSQAAIAAGKTQTNEEFYVGGSGSTVRKLDPMKISRGSFRAYPDRDSGFPESTQAKRSAFQSVLGTAAAFPEFGNQLLSAPDNASKYLSLFGIDGMVIPEAEARDKQLAEIEILLESGPVPPDPALVQQGLVEHAAASLQSEKVGQPDPPMQPPPAPKSTITPNPLDFHEAEFNKCRDWMSSAEGQRTLKENPSGFANVMAHAMEHWALKAQVPWPDLTAPQIPPAPPMAPPIAAPKPTAAPPAL